MNKVTLLDSAKAFVNNTRRYVPLLEHMIKRDVKKKYRGSVLGYLWSILNPLLIMLVMLVVFSTMFKHNIDNFPVYLFIGRMFFSFVTDATNSGMRSITGNAGLIKKTPVPKYIFPIANITSEAVTFLFSLGAFVIVLVFTGTPVNWTVIFFPFVIIQAYFFSMGLGFFLAQLNVFFRDTTHLYSVFTTAWMYLTPIFYPLESLSVPMQTAISKFNPIYFFAQQGREIFLQGMPPSGILMAKGCFSAVLMLIIGLLLFRHNQDKFILHI